MSPAAWRCTFTLSKLQLCYSRHSRIFYGMRLRSKKACIRSYSVRANVVFEYMIFEEWLFTYTVHTIYIWCSISCQYGWLIKNLASIFENGHYAADKVNFVFQKIGDFGSARQNSYIYIVTVALRHSEHYCTLYSIIFKNICLYTWAYSREFDNAF